MNIEMMNHLLVLLILVISGFSTLIFLTVRSTYKKGAKILTFFMLTVFIFTLAYVSYIHYIPSLLWVLKYLFLPSAFCMIPILYLYIKALTINNVQFSRYESLHFLPAILSLFFLVAISFFPVSDDINIYISIDFDYSTIDGSPHEHYLYYIAYDIIFFSQMAFYFTLMMILLIKHKRNIRMFFSDIEGISLTWLLAFLLFYLVTSISFIIIDFLVVAEKNVYDLVYNTASAIFVFFLSYFGVKQNDIYNHSSLKHNSIELESPSSEKILKETSQNDITQKISRKDELFNKLLELFEKEKLYLQYDLSLADIAELLNSNKHYISNIINEKLNKNFYQFVNELRIKEAIEMLNNQDSYLYTIESISQKAGFKSKSSFNKFFKEITGITPSEFRKEYKSGDKCSNRLQ